MMTERPAFPKLEPGKTTPRPVPTESFERLLRKAGDAPMRCFLLCGWLGGLRIGETMALEWEETRDASWVDLDRNRIHFPKEFVKAKTDQSVPLDPDLRAAIEALPRRGKRLFHFTAADGEPVCLITMSARVRELARLAGVKLTYKSLRRGFACYHASRVPAQVLQKLMRHANIKTTMDYYANVDDAAMQAVLGGRNTPRNTPAVETQKSPVNARVSCRGKTAGRSRIRISEQRAYSSHHRNLQESSVF
jgi:integrase